MLKWQNQNWNIDAYFHMTYIVIEQRVNVLPQGSLRQIVHGKAITRVGVTLCKCLVLDIKHYSVSSCERVKKKWVSRGFTLVSLYSSLHTIFGFVVKRKTNASEAYPVRLIGFCMWQQSASIRSRVFHLKNNRTRWLNAYLQQFSVSSHFHHEPEPPQNEKCGLSSIKSTPNSDKKITLCEKKEKQIGCQLHGVKYPVRKKRMMQRRKHKSALRCQAAITLGIWWMIECH